MTQEKSSVQPQTLTDWMRKRTGKLTSGIGHRLYLWGIHPDVITIIGTIIVAIAAYVIAQGHFFWATIIIVAGAPLDALDGAVARAMQRKGKFGAFLDSTLDRYSDGLIFVGLAYYFSEHGHGTEMVVSMLALIGTQLVSYTRARAEGLGLDCKVGLFTRMERMGVILIMLLTGWVKIGVWVLAIGTNFTVLQRALHVYRTINHQGDTSA